MNPAQTVQVSQDKLAATKPLLGYPLQAEFEELLNSCGSMTRQLESSGHRLSVTLLSASSDAVFFNRYVTLNLNDTPVVAACSRVRLTNHFFNNLLRQADTTPIGKFLFAPNSHIKRHKQMELNQVTRAALTAYPVIIESLIHHRYQPDQLFWLRKSIFEHAQEQFELTEILLPEMQLFF